MYRSTRLWTLPLVILIFFNLFESYTTDMCPKNKFQCDNGHCVPFSQHCNGKNDCGDNTDENNCSPCPYGEFPCSNNNCIGMSLKCDGDDDCGDKSDERNCDEDDRCQKFGVCSQLCNTTEEGFTCSCFDGYYLDPSNNRSCKAELGHGELLLVNAYDLRRFDFETRENTFIVANATNAIAIDYDFNKKLVVWSDVTERCIYGADIETGKSKKVIVKDKIRHPSGLAVDWIYGNVYWTDSVLYGRRKSINVASLDGKLIKSLIETNLTNPFALVIDPLEGWMFWTDVVKGSATRGSIEKAGMDGSHRKTIASKYTHQPNGLTIDVMSKKLYWVEAEKPYSLLISDYDGLNVKVIRSSIRNSWSPLSIDVFEDSLYYVSLNKIYEADKFTGKPRRRRIGWDHIILKGVRVYHSYKQPTGPNYCAENNGGCSHLCLPAPHFTPDSAKYACACPDDMKLSDDQQNCTIIKTTRRVWTTSIPSTTTISTPSTTVETTSSVLLSIQTESTQESITKKKQTNNWDFMFDTKTTTSALTTPTKSENVTQETFFINETQHDAITKMDHSEILTHTVTGVIVIGSVIGFIFVISSVSYFIYKQHSKGNINAMHFENPLYRKTSKDLYLKI